jgi:SET and MYND domain-containing protein
MRAPSAPPSDTGFIEDSLAALVFASSTLVVPNEGHLTLGALPSSLGCIRHEEFMKNLSKRFENETHDGPYDTAWRTGRALLASCLLQYPKNYPLTGQIMHTFSFIH